MLAILNSLAMSLFLTLIFELGITHILGVRGKENKKIVVLVNVITNPLLVFIVITLMTLQVNKILLLSCIAMLEFIAFTVEGILYSKYLNYNKINPFVLSLIANVFSYSLGEILKLIF